MSAFDPIPGRSYGTCLTCSLDIETEEASREHMSQTFDEAKARGESTSHRITITNAPRADRIRARVACIVEDAINESMRDFDRLVDRGDITEAELAEALRWHPDFADAREEYVAGDES